MLLVDVMEHVTYLVIWKTRQDYDMHNDNDLVYNILNTTKYDRLWSDCKTF